MNCRLSLFTDVTHRYRFRYVPEGVVRLLASKECVARLGVAHREVNVVADEEKKCAYPFLNYSCAS